MMRSDAAVIFDFVARIVPAVSCPVTADREAGYRLTATALVGQMLAAGIVGCNLEDTDHHGRNVLVHSHRPAAYLARVRDAAEAAGVRIVINARVDTFMRYVGGNDEQLEEAIRRGRLYLEAGAGRVYPIGVSDPGQIATLVDAMPGPLNRPRISVGIGVGQEALPPRTLDVTCGSKIPYPVLRNAEREVERRVWGFTT